MLPSFLLLMDIKEQIRNKYYTPTEEALKVYEIFKELNFSRYIERFGLNHESQAKEKGKNTQEKDISIHCHKDAVHGKADYI